MTLHFSCTATAPHTGQTIASELCSIRGPTSSGSSAIDATLFAQATKGCGGVFISLRARLSIELDRFVEVFVHAFATFIQDREIELRRRIALVRCSPN